MTTQLRPETAAETRDAVNRAIADATPLEIAGHGSKSGWGRAERAGRRLDLSGLSGIALYEADELVMTAAAGTPIADIEAQLDRHDQCLAFEPPDWGGLLGGPEGAATIGGVLGCNLSGPRRIKAGAARDHFLGVAAVSGRGEIFKSGGRVVKNVTGYDMCKLLAGSFGTLAVMTEVTFKVVPAADKVRTVLVYGLADSDAIAALAQALKGPHDVSAAAHLPAAIAAASGVEQVRGERAVSAVRIEGPEPSVAARCAALKDELAALGEVEELHRHNSTVLWREIADVAPFAGADRERAVWRLSVPPAAGAEAVTAIARGTDASAYYDWGGGLVWLALADDDGAGHETVRKAVDRFGGHATLVRASAETRAAVPVFQPQPEALAALTERIKHAFDPSAILNPGRMYAGV